MLSSVLHLLSRVKDHDSTSLLSELLISKNICVSRSARENITVITLNFEHAHYEKPRSYIITEEWRLDAIAFLPIKRALKA